MRYKILALFILSAAFCGINAYAGIACMLCVVAFALFILMNLLFKLTHSYNNNYVYTGQFVSNMGYRKNLNRNLEIVNVGSNPARFAFFYENIKGVNWSTGTQGLDMDLEILKYYHSYIKEGGYVLLPIVAFSSVSAYIGTDSTDISYYAKFFSIIWNHPGIDRQLYKKAKRWMKYPLCHNPKLAFKLVHDVEKDDRLQICEQQLCKTELVEDAGWWMDCWKKEFDIKDFNAPLSGDLSEARKKTVAMFREILDFVIERGYKPVIISPPVAKELCELFIPQIKEIYVDSFVREFKDYDVPYLDYIYDERFSDSSLYFNSLFMNLRGRKLFTNDVLNRLGLDR